MSLNPGIGMAEILVVDGSPEEQQLLAAALIRHGYTVRLAADGKLALKEVSAAPPNLILLYVGLSDKSGLEMCCTLKQIPQFSDIPVIFISLVNDPQHRLAAFNAGAVDYLVQPFEIEEVKARIHTHLEQKRFRDRLGFKAGHDSLTGLPNRTLLHDRLLQAISYADRYERQVAVAFIDLDKFKQVNDRFGHDAGDQLLVTIAQRLLACVRESDTVARLGGDEFVVVLYDQANEDVTLHAMQRMLQSIAEPILLNGLEYRITCSIGFSFYPQDGRDAETILKNADTAMYRAKELGRDNFQFYTGELHRRINERLALDKSLRLAIERNEFILHFQPRIDLRTGKVDGLEALIRWTHPELGVVQPQRFIPLAEEIGLMHRIGDWVMRSACLQYRMWERDGVTAMPIAVNISAPQFLQKGFAGIVANVLRDTGVAPDNLELEITESLSMRDPRATIQALQELRNMGVKLSIDDFGTGYSNLSYLKQFAVDKIKLDQSFVHQIERNPDDLAISDAIISMAHSLRLKVTAEGVESESQLALLSDHGCDGMQGHYFSPAVPVDACTALLRENRALPLEKLGRRRSRRTLLLVDDEPNVLSALARTLQATGYHILKAPNAMKAFDLLATHEVGVILSDQRMPGMTGVELFSRVRFMYPSTVRIILSGYADLAAVTDAINLGAVYKFLNKPWVHEVLCEILEEAFQKYESEQRLVVGA